jgi:cytoskeletal protein RodZ
MALDAPPVTVPGAVLKQKREEYGIEQQAIAAELRHHRNTIAAWEKDDAVDLRRQRLYLAAVRKIADAAA